MSELSTIVQLSISANSRSVTRKGFGTALILGYHTKWLDRFRIYSDLSSMVTDGFATYEPIYRKAAAAFSQNPAPQSVIVGRLPAAPTFTQTLTVTTATAGQLIQCKVISPATGVITQITRTVPGSSTTTAEATALAALINAVSGMASTASAAIATVTPTVAGTFPYIYDCVNCTYEETTADASYATELAALQLVNDDWYWINIDSSSQANVQGVAAWTLTQPKIFMCTSASAGELAGTGTLGSTLKAATNKRTAGLWAPNLQECADAAWTGAIAPLDPGTFTTMFMQLIGVSPKNPAITTTQKGNLELNNWNHYMTVAGASITRNGVLFDGEFIDLVQGTDALQAQIQQDLFSALINTRKIQITDSGLAILRNVILGSLRQFESSSDTAGLLIEGSSKVVMPLASSISTQNKLLRKVPGIKFYATYAQAVHSVSLVGTINV